MTHKLKQKNMWMYWCGCIGKRRHDLPLAIQCWFAERFAAMTAGWYQPKSGWMIELTKLSNVEPKHCKVLWQGQVGFLVMPIE